ncbi:MAG: hypothetical protein DRP08_01835 [Candidatus Aenigmatarchaeota archaeon]|nr:MAG: hypothetical protein DRP08_01835 [Candidatus Aenigmarchaeota archaeon]
MFLVRKTKNGLEATSASEFKPPLNKIDKKIILLLKKRPMYAREIARELGIEQQKIYYHIKCLKKRGLIKLDRIVNEAVATKFYRLASSAFVFSIGQFRPVGKIISTPEKQRKFIEPFIIDGKLNTKIIIGSPDPHGPESARARDGYYASDFSIFFGSFLSFSPMPAVVLDTELKNKKQNLILIGGPIVNKITEKINSYLPIKFKNKKIYSSLSKKTYSADCCGVIEKIKNPFDKSKSVMIIAGLRSSGTKSAILAFLKKFDEICKGNRYKRKYAKVVLGLDKDADGIIDSVEILE